MYSSVALLVVLASNVQLFRSIRYRRNVISQSLMAIQHDRRGHPCRGVATGKEGSPSKSRSSKEQGAALWRLRPPFSSPEKEMAGRNRTVPNDVNAEGIFPECLYVWFYLPEEGHARTSILEEKKRIESCCAMQLSIRLRKPARDAEVTDIIRIRLPDYFLVFSQNRFLESRWTKLVNVSSSCVGPSPYSACETHVAPMTALRSYKKSRWWAKLGCVERSRPRGSWRLSGSTLQSSGYK